MTDRYSNEAAIAHQDVFFQIEKTLPFGLHDLYKNSSALWMLKKRRFVFERTICWVFFTRSFSDVNIMDTHCPLGVKVISLQKYM